MFKVDRPIEGLDEDRLGRAAFAKRLASAFANSALDDSVVVGLSGPWGSGKTSLVNMVIKEMENIEEGQCSTVVVRFNPWNSLGEEGIIESFFDSVIYCLKENPAIPIADAKFWVELSKDFSEYADALRPGWKKAIVKTAARRSVLHAQRKAHSIPHLKNKIKKNLKDFNLRILVVVDDLDRLSEEQICLIFQLVAAIADFPSVSYLLAYDRGVVERALGSVQKTDGSKYLEKIIQVPIDLPDSNPGTIATLLSKELEMVHAYIQGEDYRLDASSRLANLSELIAPRVETIRNLKRFSSVLSFELAGCAKEVDPVDLTAMVFLRMFYPDAIFWVKTEGELLRLSGSLSDPVRGYSEENGQLVSVLKKQGVKNASDVSAFIQHIFIEPRIFGSENELTIGDYRGRKRLVIKEVFDAYLCGTSDSINPMFDFMRQALQLRQEDVVRDVLGRLEGGRYSDILESFLALKHDIDLKMAPRIIEAFARAIPSADYSDPHYSENSRTIDLMDFLAKKLGDEFPSVCEDLFFRLDDKSVIYLAEFIVRQERVRSRNGFSGGYGYSDLFSLDTLEKLEKGYVEAAERSLESGEMINWDNLFVPLTLWKNLDNESFASALDAAVAKNPLAVVLHAHVFTHSWQSHSLSRGFTRGWGTSSEVEEYLSRDALLAKISEAFLSADFQNLPLNSQRRVVALEDGVSKRDYSPGSDSIDMVEVDKRLVKIRG